MQIQKLSSQNRTFGYNVLVNRELIRTLEESKKNKAFNNYVKEMVLATNKAEIELRDAEINNKLKLAGMLATAFIPAKIFVTNLVNHFYPQSKYRENEMASYVQEMEECMKEGQAPSQWQKSIFDTLSEYEKQEQTMRMTAIIAKKLHKALPNVKFDLLGLAGEIRREYVDGNGDNEAVKKAPKSHGPELSLSNDDKIELGKKCVEHYEPKTELEKLGFDSLSGMRELKDWLRKRVITPLKDPARAKYNEEHYGIKRPNGILLYGPPGTGKTTITERLAVEAELPLLELTRDKMGSVYVDGSGINLGAVFDYAASLATEEKPVILFIDDFDSIFASRDNPTIREDSNKEVGIILKRIQDAPKNNILVVAATNKYDNIDKAVSSRLRYQMYVGYLDEEGRKDFFKMKLEELDNGRKLANDEKAIERIAKLTEGFPTRALEDFVDESIEKAEIDFYNVRDIELSDFEEIIAKPENQNKKDKEELYKTKATRKSIGFG